MLFRNWITLAIAGTNVFPLSTIIGQTSSNPPLSILPEQKFLVAQSESSSSDLQPFLNDLVARFGGGGPRDTPRNSVNGSSSR